MTIQVPCKPIRKQCIQGVFLFHEESHHLHLVSDRPYNDGDYVYSKKTVFGGSGKEDLIFKFDSRLDYSTDFGNPTNFKKVEQSTDKTLGLPEPMCGYITNYIEMDGNIGEGFYYANIEVPDEPVLLRCYIIFHHSQIKKFAKLLSFLKIRFKFDIKIEQFANDESFMIVFRNDLQKYEGYAIDCLSYDDYLKWKNKFGNQYKLVDIDVILMAFDIGL